MKNKTMIFSIMILCAMAVVFLVPARAAVSMSPVAVECNLGVCFEENTANWTFMINNTDNTSLILQRIRVLDTANVPVADFALNSTSIAPNTAQYIWGLSKMPAPTRGTSLYFIACFTVNDKEYCEQNPHQMTVYALRDMNCLFSTTCADNEVCALSTVGTTCAKLDCVNDTMALNHTCIPKGPTVSFSEVNVFIIIIIVLVIAIIAILVLYLRKKSRYQVPSVVVGKSHRRS